MTIKFDHSKVTLKDSIGIEFAEAVKRVVNIICDKKEKFDDKDLASLALVYVIKLKKKMIENPSIDIISTAIILPNEKTSETVERLYNYLKSGYVDIYTVIELLAHLMEYNMATKERQ